MNTHKIVDEPRRDMSRGMEHIAGNAEALSKFVAKKPPESQRRFDPLAYSIRHRVM
jgi:hypothetical protein